MKIEPLKNEEGFEFKGPFLITPQIFGDQRGFFYESWNKNVFDININSNVNFVPEKISPHVEGSQNLFLLGKAQKFSLL